MRGALGAAFGCFRDMVAGLGAPRRGEEFARLRKIFLDHMPGFWYDLRHDAASCAGVAVSGEKLPTPLDVLLVTMHRKWQAGDQDGAASLARVAAPYLHARRLAARHATDVETMDDAELGRTLPTRRPARIRRGRRRRSGRSAARHLAGHLAQPVRAGGWIKWVRQRSAPGWRIASALPGPRLCPHAARF